MKKVLVGIIAIIIAVSCEAQSPQQLAADNAVIDTNKVILPGSNHTKVNQVITKIMMRAHYKKTDLNDSLASVIFDNFIKTLDNNKLYFLQSDIEEFELYRNMFDDYLDEGVLDPAYEIFNVFKTRVNERIDFALDRLVTGFDFEVDEYFTPDRKDTTWAETEEQLNELWRMRLKSDALNLVLDDDEWEDIAKNLSNRYKYFHKTILQYKSEDVFQIYMNAFSEAIDPHTSYFPQLLWIISE